LIQPKLQASAYMPLDKNTGPFEFNLIAMAIIGISQLNKNIITSVERIISENLLRRRKISLLSI
jgi:hypothetical protein